MDDDSTYSFLEPGMLVRNPDNADWGLGQVQSRVGHRITVNFENAGKVVIDGRVIALRSIVLPDSGSFSHS